MREMSPFPAAPVLQDLRALNRGSDSDASAYVYFKTILVRLAQDAASPVQ